MPERYQSSSGIQRISRQGRRKTEETTQQDLINELITVARENQLTPPEKKEPLSALRKIAGILNIGTAASAGAVRGLLDENTSVVRGIYEGIQNRETFGFADVIREDLGIKGDTRAEKFGIGAIGLAADILFDPLTYLSFGISGASKVAKVGTKTLSKEGTKLASQATKNLLKNRTAEFLEKGIALETAEKLAQKKTSGLVNDLLLRSTGKKGLTDQSVKEFVERGFEESDLLVLQSAGKQLIDQGGIKLFGKTLVSSKQLAKTPLGKAARRLGETEIAQAVKNTLGNTFVADFGKSKKLAEIVAKSNREQARAISGIVEANSELFKGLNDEQMGTFFDTVFSKKKEVIKKVDEIEEEGYKKLKELFPETTKIDSREKALKVMSKLEDGLTERMTRLQNIQDNLVKGLFEERKKSLALGKTVANVGEQFTTSPIRSLDKVDELNKFIDKTKAAIKALKKPGQVKRGVDKSTGEVIGASEKEAVAIFDKIVIDEEMRLSEKLEKLIGTLEKKKAQQGVKVAAKAISKSAKPENVIDELKLVQDEMLKIQSQFTQRSQALQQIIDARRIAKKRLRNDKLFFEDEMLQKISDTLFEGEDSITKRFSRIAGISEQDAIKFYIPSKFSDKVAVKDFLMGRNLTSPKLGFRKKFTGVEENLIRNPFEAFSRGQIEVVSGRIKSDAFNTAAKSIGRPLEELSEQAAKQLGYKKVGRTGFDGKKIEAWFPKEVADELTNFLEPKSDVIDDFAKSMGFDWATGLFKAYVTSLFPGFHVRNITSNQFQNMIKVGVDVANPIMQKNALDIVRGVNLERAIKLKNGKTVTLKSIREMVEKESDILDASGPFGKIEQMLDAADPVKRTTKKNLNPFSRENVVLERARKFGGDAESQAKMVTVLSSVINGQTVKQGIENAEEVLFNYGKLTKFEKTIMRRVIPFYTFGRKNFELQLKTLMRKPGFVANELKAMRGVGNAVGEPITEDDIEGLPSYILEGIGIKAGAYLKDPFGRDTFLTGFGLPIEEFLQRFSGEDSFAWNFFKTTLEQTNPVLKYPSERATGQDFFRGRPISEVTNAQDIKELMDIMPEKVAKEFAEMIEFREIPEGRNVYVNGELVGKENKYTANPFALHFIRNLPSSRILATVGFVSDEGEAPINRTLRFFTGVRGFSIDKEQQKFFEELEQRRELEDWLIRMGVGAKFERFFVPKEEKRSSRRTR